MNRNRLRSAFDYSLVIALACLLVLLLAAWWLPPAHAADGVEYGDPAATDVPTVVYPIRAVDGSVPHVVVVQAPRLSWRSRMVARAWDLAVPGLDVRTGPCVPELPCIRVHVGYWSPEQALEVSGGAYYAFGGLTVYTGDSVRDVFLNRAHCRGCGRTFVASHEIAHALGLAHHRLRDGVLGSHARSWIWRPGDAEADALALYFTGPYA